MKLNEDLRSRLVNYKFGSALEYICDENEEVQDLVNALSDNFGDIGWFEGGISIIVRHALENIGVPFHN